jgi:hypothetical protein
MWHKADRKDPFRVGKKSMTEKEWETVTSGQKSAYADPKQSGINLDDESCH